MSKTRLLIAAVLVLVVATFVVAGILYAVRPPPEVDHTRPVVLRVTGVPEAGALVLSENGRVLEGDDDRYILGDRPTPSVARIEWTLGPGCAEGCPDRCPSWCALGVRDLHIPRGKGVHEAELAIEVPEPQEVRIHANAPLSRARLADQDGAVEDMGAVFQAITPGPYELLLESGECPEEALGCASAGDGCPTGCTSWTQSVAIPASDLPTELDIALPLPVEDTPPAPAPRSAGPVSARAFARFVDAHPEWKPGAAIAAGRADARYLKGWEDGPPAGPATRVTWGAAEAYCQGRGGLATLDAAPRTWDRSRGPTQEWRRDGGQPAWRRFDGVTSSTKPPDNRAFSFTGFRCAR